MIEQINHLAQLWWDWMSAMFWQVGLLILLIALIDLLIRRWAWPQLRYALWSLILLKLVLSPGLSLPSGLAPKLKPVVTQMLETAAQEKLIEVKLPIAIPSARDEFRQSVTPHASYTLADVEDIPAVDGPVEATGPLVRVGPRLDWRVYAMAVWLLGATTLGMWLFVKLYRLSRKYPDGPRQPALPESFYDQLERCAQKLNLRRKPRVVATTHLQSPAVFGPFRPVLLMPVGYIRKLSRKDTEYMLLHELAHIKRGDLIAHSFYMLLQLVYWYNPLLWLVRKQLRHLRELCCDATVASLLRDRTVEYRQTLLEAARRFLATPAETGLALVGLFEDSNRLIARINWLKKPVWRYRKMKSAAVITVVLVLLACVLPMAQGQQKSADPNDRQETVSAEQAEESSSPSEQTVTTEQDQIQAKEQLLQAQKVLQAQAERLQIERKTLEQLRIDKQQLLQQVQKLIQAQQAKNEAAQVELKAKLAQEIVAQVLAQAKQAEAKALKAKTEAEAKKADAEARKAEAEAKKAKALAKQLELWAGSDAFKQGQKNLDKWAQEQAKAHEKVQEADALVVPVPNPDPQPMPVVAPAPMPPSEAEAVGDAPAPPAPAAAEAVASPPPAPAAPIAPASPAPPEPPSAVAPPLPAVPVLPAMPAAPAAPPAPSNVPLLSAAATVEPAPAPPA
ncbi:MAG: M56 family metallopeptidase, partial [Sedimentisphaerales bacterium]